MNYETKYHTLRSLFIKLLAAQKDAKENRTNQGKQMTVKRIEGEILAELNDKPKATQGEMEWWGK